LSKSSLARTINSINSLIILTIDDGLNSSLMFGFEDLKPRIGSPIASINSLM